MSAIRKLQRNVIKNQHSVTKDDDSGGAKSKKTDKRKKHYNDSKSSINYLRAMKASDMKNNSQSKANTNAKAKVC